MVLPLVVQVAVDDYGSTQDADIFVPLTMTMDPTNSNNHPSPSKKKKTTTTKWMVACILGLTAKAVVLSSAVLFVSRIYSSSVLRAAIRTEEAFLLHHKDGTCVPASGACPPGTETVTDAGTNSFLDDDVNYFSCPYSTCLVLQNDRCWSHSYINSDSD